MLNILVKFGVLLSIMGVLIFPAEVIETGKNALELSLFRVIPSLFPFFVLQSMAFATGLSQWLSKTVGKIFCVLFKIPDASPYILGILGGYPVGFKSVISLYKENKVDKKTAERMLGFCNNAGPAFIIGFVGVTILGDKNLGYILVLGHFISSVIIGILTSLKAKKPKIANKNIKLNQSLTEKFISAVNIGFSSCLAISGYIIFFSVISQLLNLFGAFNTLSVWLMPILKLCGMTETTIKALLIGLAEMTTGLNHLNIGDISMQMKLIISSILLAFGGMSIHFQSLNFNCGLDTKLYIKTKILHMILAPITTIMVLNITDLHKNTPVSFSCTPDKYCLCDMLTLVASSCLIYLLKKPINLAKKRDL